MKKVVKSAGIIVLVLIVAYNAVYFKSLAEVRAQNSEFDASSYAQKFYKNQLLPLYDSAMPLTTLLVLLQQDKDAAFDKYGHAISIGSVRYFLVSGEGVVRAVNDNDVALSLPSDSVNAEVKVAAEFVFGNAIRDASGKISLSEFANLSDINSVSSELNKIVRSQVLPPFNRTVKAGDRIQFFGAVDFNRERLNLNEVEVIPIQLNIVK